MSDLKTKPTDYPVSDFLSNVCDEQKRQECEILLNLMREVSGEEPVVWGDSMIGFGKYHYIYASGREGDWLMIGFSPRKQNLVVYLMSGVEQYGDLLQQLGKHKVGKSCIYIKRISDIDIGILRILLIRALEHLRQTQT